MRDRLRGVARAEPLPTLLERHPNAARAARRAHGLQVVPLDRLVGTVRQPTQNTADFLPLPVLRGRNWDARWKRILKAVDQLSVLPPIEVVQVGDEYYVVDGHNRVAAALRAGAVAIDGDVTELILPGAAPAASEHGAMDAHTLLIGSDEVREAAAGRQSRTSERRSALDEIRREELADDDAVQRAPEDPEAPAGG
jgi:hypothetical protein